MPMRAASGSATLMTRIYALPHFRLAVDWPDPGLARHGARMLAYHGFEPADGPAETSAEASAANLPRITFAPTLPPTPADAREVNRHESGLRVLRDARRTILRYTGLRADLRAGDPHVRIYLDRAARPLDADFDPYLFIALTLVVVTLLQRAGYYAVHAAALCRRPEAGLLLVAESDAGKSTLTLHLVECGWRYLSDDTVFLHRPEPGSLVDALPFRRQLGLDPERLDERPDLAAAAEPQLTDPEKWSVDLERRYPGRLVERCTPRVLVFPALAARTESRLAPLAPSETLVRVMRQNSFVEADPDTARRHLEALNKLVGQCAAYTLEAGRDLRDDPAAAHRLLAPLVAG